MPRAMRIEQELSELKAKNEDARQRMPCSSTPTCAIWKRPVKRSKSAPAAGWAWSKGETLIQVKVAGDGSAGVPVAVSAGEKQ